MLTAIPVSFSDRRTAQTALTEFRKRYRVALRGACITGPDYHGAYTIHAPLEGTGFSPAEFMLPAHFFVSSTEGALFDTRVFGWSAKPLRAEYCKTFADIANTLQLRATLRAGKYAWPGRYPLYFISSDGEALSFESVRANYAQCAYSVRRGIDDGWRIIGCAINYEDNELICAHSGKPIESAYGSAE